jgi:hypothetical protein
MHPRYPLNPDPNAERRSRGRADVVLDRERGLCILYSPDPYDIDLDDIRTEAQFSEWVYHLKEKSWVTDEQLAQFMRLIAEYKGFALPDQHLGPRIAGSTGSK